MLKFPQLDQSYPDIEAAARRKLHFGEIYANFVPEAARAQASRCSQCGVPFCQVHCPLQNNIPDWLKLTAEGRLEEAYALSSATNTFPEVCGRICPQDRLCEGNCVIEHGFSSVTIGAIEKFITETAFANDWVKPIRVEQENGLSVGIIGAGPAGLAAADMLRRMGYAVDIYDRYDRMGGLMIYGIPNFKLDKAVVLRRYELLTAGGIRFTFNCEVGRNISLQELRQRHTAVLIATGVYKARELGVLGHDMEGIIPALPYLTAENRRGLGDAMTALQQSELSAKGRDVVVIGGGDTAMDCVRTAVRQGARSVTCLYRRDRANMPGSPREVKNAEEEGVHFSWLSAPKAFVGDKRVSQLIVQRMRIASTDASGRHSVAAVEGETTTLPCDLAIKALGFDAEDLPVMFGEPGLALTRYGTLAVSAGHFETSLSGVYAAGDIVRGASLVVWAIRDGRDAALAMHQDISRRLRKGAQAA